MGPGSAATLWPPSTARSSAGAWNATGGPRYAPGIPNRRRISRAALSVQERTALSNIHQSWKPGEDVPIGYPSHLHINLLPQLQGRGVGRRLIETLLARLREQGSPGLHLATRLTNLRAAGFYRHLGFTELAASDKHMFAMDLRDR